MFRKLIKNKKAQNTAEYALLIALVVAAIIAMQTYAQRALQARIRDASSYLTTLSPSDGAGIGTTAQYEPYYLESSYDVTSTDSDTQTLLCATTRQETLSNRSRAAGGYQSSFYNDDSGGINVNPGGGAGLP